MEPANRRTIALGIAAAGLVAGVRPAAAQEEWMEQASPRQPAPVPLQTASPAQQDAPPPQEPPPAREVRPPAENTYSEDEIVNATSRFFGMGAETVASVVRRIFRDLGNPVGFIEGSEGSAALAIGLRYGEGRLYLNHEPATTKIFWRGPSVGFDTGANAAKCFTLIYGVTNPSEMFQRFPGVEGSAYFIGGVGVNYQRADEITLAPMRTGVGFRLGANIGYLAYSRQRRFLPF